MAIPLPPLDLSLADSGSAESGGDTFFGGGDYVVSRGLSTVQLIVVGLVVVSAFLFLNKGR